MAHINYNLSVVGGLESSPSFTQFAQLLPVVSCNNNVPNGWVESVGNLWNCQTYCAPNRFYQTFQKGDVIPFQFQLVDSGNTNIMQPAKGWKNSHDLTNYYIKCELLLEDCITVYSSNADAFCTDFWVSFNNRVGSIQTMFLDTGLLPIGTNVFSLRVTTYDQTYTPVTVLYSEPFVATICDETHVFSSYSQTRDKFGNRYDMPTAFYSSSVAGVAYVPTPYFTQMRVACNMLASTYATEYERNDNEKVLSSKHIDTFDISVIPLMPAYYAEMLANCTQCDTVLIDGIEYTNISAVTRNNSSSMFKIDITADKVLNISSRKCN